MTWQYLVFFFCVFFSINTAFSKNITDPLEVEAGNSESICHGGTLELQGSVLTTVPVDIEWTTTNGTIVSGAKTLNPIINKAGIYYLNVSEINGICTGIDSVEIIQIDYPFINFKIPNEINCDNPEVTLDASNSSNSSGMIALWQTTDGNIISSPDEFVIEVDKAGTYYFTVSDDSGECSLTDSLVIVGEAVFPLADAGESMTLTCAITTLTLNGGATYGPEIFYEWETDDGNIVSGEETLKPVIDAPGNYLLTVWSDITDCETTASVIIYEDLEAPIAEAGKDGELSCAITKIILNGTISSVGDDFIYDWKTTDGNILLDKNTLTPTVDLGGEYTLTVTDTTNGCIAEDAVFVNTNLDAPTIDIASPPAFTCATSFLFINANNSSTGSQFQYDWTTTDGLILDDENTSQPLVGGGGTYILTVTDLVNECFSTDSVVVLTDTIPPTIQIESPENLTCTTKEVTLDGSASTQGPTTIFQWQTSDGNILSGENTSMPIVDAIGNYELTVLNIFNGCSSEMEVSVNQDIELPIAEAGEPFTLNCNLTLEALDGSFQNAQNGQFEWTTSDGNFVSASNIQTPIVDEPGTYSLLVTNTENGCTDTDEVIIDENVLLDFEFENTLPTCNHPFGNLTFGNIEGGEAPFIFSIDNGATFQAENTFENLEAGQYDLVIQDMDGCEISDEAFIPNIAQPVISLEEKVILEWGDTYKFFPQLNFDEDQIAEISWSPAIGLDCSDCLSPSVTPSENMIYQIQITDKNGCIATEEISLQINKDLKIYIPNAFSPDGDGLNDQFTVFAKPNIVSQVKTFTIFDRWGTQIFSKNDFQPNDVSEGWNGKKEGQEIKTGVYVYFAEIEFIDGQKEVFKGDVFLKN